MMWAWWPHWLDDRLRAIEGEQQLLHAEQARLRERIRQIEIRSTDDGK
jgi:hypothetical protein